MPHVGAAQKLARNPQPQMPYVKRAPCEGYCTYYKAWAACSTVTMRAAPRRSSKALGEIQRGTRVRVLDGLERVERAGIVVFKDTVTYREHLETDNGPVYPKNGRVWHFAPGDTVWVVDHVTDGDAEEEYTWYYRGKSVNGQSFWTEAEYVEYERREGGDVSDEKAILVRDRDYDWWVKVRTPDRRVAWIAFDDAQWSGTSYYDDPPDACTASAR
jgi:hypothetical protein